MISIVAREVGVEDQSPALLVGFCESDEAETGQDLFFQCDLRVNNYPEISNWPEGESYPVSDQSGRSAYGGVAVARLSRDRFYVKFRPTPVRDLQLDDTEFDIMMDDPDVDLASVGRFLRDVLNCGRPEYWPEILKIDVGSGPAD